MQLADCGLQNCVPGAPFPFGIEVRSKLNEHRVKWPPRSCLLTATGIGRRHQAARAVNGSNGSGSHWIGQGKRALPKSGKPGFRWLGSDILGTLFN